ncbi:MAG: hypothetical protein M3R25_14930 [Bacteroidota bacterium]|nr:hypothetical protein [Bacteroidota bacterium]
MRILFVFNFILLLGSCTTRHVEPTRQSRHTIDTVFQQKSILMQTELDRYCDSIYGKIYQTAVDSIMSEREAEMNILVQ